jgi:NAD(P)-dependent dehydrogenase (short-subunit alcohol dehydrogenase family)
MRLKDKVCIVTGAAGAMGALATEIFCREGATVVAADIDGTEGSRVAARAEGAGPGQASFVQADVSVEGDCRRLADHAIRTFGRVDVLYNNAGIMPEADRSVIDFDPEVWDRVHRVNVGGIVMCSKYVIPSMIEQGGGSVINIASFVAFMGCTVPQDAYTASKGAIVSLTRSMAVQFGPHGIRTNAICPGPIETPLMSGLLASEEEARAKRLNRIPLGRFGRPEDVVYLGLHLASDESGWTNGTAIVVDGGISCNYF